MVQLLQPLLDGSAPAPHLTEAAKPLGGQAGTVIPAQSQRPHHIESCQVTQVKGDKASPTTNSASVHTASGESARHVDGAVKRTGVALLRQGVFTPQKSQT